MSRPPFTMKSLEDEWDTHTIAHMSVPYRIDVLEVDSRSLIETHRARLWLCPINSGATKPFPRARDESYFARIDDYSYSDWRRKRRKGERVVEIAVDYSVPDIRTHVRRVVAKKVTDILSVIE